MLYLSWVTLKTCFKCKASSGLLAWLTLAQRLGMGRILSQIAKRKKSKKGLNNDNKK